VQEGQVSLLGGLIQKQDDKTVTGIPGLMNIPLLGRLFSGQSVDHNNDEIMIALIPHIVRRPDITPENLRTIAVGNATTIKLNYAPRPSDGVPVKQGAAGTPPAVASNPAAVLPNAPAAQPAPPATAPPATAPPAPPPPPAAAGAPPATAPAPSPGGTARVFFQPPVAPTFLNSAFKVAVSMENGTDVAGAPMQIQFDPKFLKLNDVTAGDFLGQGQAVQLTKNIQNDSGLATVQIVRSPGSPGVSGMGVLVNLIFQSVNRGSTEVLIPNVRVTNTQGQVLASGVDRPLTVNIR
jgi:general secretion pathway protein D